MLLAAPGNGISHIRARQAVYPSALRRDAAASRNFAGRQQPGRTNPNVSVSFINAVDLITRKHLLFLSHHFTSMILRKLTDGGGWSLLSACIFSTLFPDLPSEGPTESALSPFHTSALPVFKTQRWLDRVSLKSV